MPSIHLPATVRNWHKRNTGAAREIPVTLYVSGSCDPYPPHCQISLRDDDGRYMRITFTEPDALRRFKAQLDHCGRHLLAKGADNA
jgi:hypothetical protein